MSFFDDASLVMIPSGYKDQKVYSVKPTDGTGDLTFSRASNATRVGPDGLIEKVRTNLALYSEQFDNAYWTKTNTTVVANSGIAPDGTTTAELVYPTTTGSNRLLEKSFSISASTPYTGTWYLKASGLSWVAVDHIDGDVGAWFNLSTGTIGTISAGSTASIENLGNGWYRCRVSKTSAGGTGYQDIRLVDGDNVISVTANGTDGLLVWGAQLETGDIATAYIPTTTAAVSVGPVSGLPRLDYLGSSCPRLLLEPQRTNSAQYSEQVDNAYWLKFQATITANQATAPDGTISAERLTASGATALIYRTGMTAGALSFFIKAETLSGGARFYIGVDGVGSASWSQNGVLFSVTGGTATNAVNYGNGWYRCNFNVTSGSIINYGLENAVSGNSAFIWGFQNEASATYATSYIPTLGASVTRVADAASKTGISSLIGQTEGTLFVDVVVNGQQNASCNLFNSEKNVVDSFYIQRTSSGTINAGVFANSTLYNVNAGSIAIGQRAKIALAYKSGSTALYINGALIGTRTESWTFTSSLDDIFLNDVTTYFAYQENVSFNQAILFKTRLTNAQLAELTA